MQLMFVFLNRKLSLCDVENISVIAYTVYASNDLFNVDLSNTVTCFKSKRKCKC